MQLTIAKQDLQGALSLAQSIADRKSTMPILANAYLSVDGDTLTCAATDLIVSVSATVPCKATEDGKTTIAAKHLHDIIKSLPTSEVEMKTEANCWTHLKCGKSKYKLVGLEGSTFPKLPDPGKAKFSKVPADVLREMIAKTIYAVSTDEDRQHLAGVCVEAEEDLLRMVATDGHRMTLVERSITAKVSNGSIIPRKGLTEISKALEGEHGDCSIAFGKTHVFVRVGNVDVSVKLVDAQFPPYQAVIPKESSKSVVANRATLQDTVKRIAILSANDKVSSAIRMTVKPGLVEFHSDSPELGEAQEEFEVIYEGEEMTLCVNPKYMLDVLAQIEETEVHLAMGSDIDPCVVTPHDSDNDTYLGIIMPMRM